MSQAVQKALNAIPHWLHVVLFVFAGAFVGYLQQNETTLLAAVGHWQSAEPIVIGAGLAGVTALVSLAKQSWLPPVASILLLGLALQATACSLLKNDLPEAASDVASLAGELLSDVEHGESADVILEDLGKMVLGDAEPIAIALVDTLLADQKTPAADKPALTALQSAARAKLASKHAAAAIQAGASAASAVTR